MSDSVTFRDKPFNIRSRLWIDSPGADERLKSLKLPTRIHNIIKGIIQDGFAIVRGTVSAADCRKTIADYEAYLGNFAKQAYTNSSNHNIRLANFHMTSASAMRIATNNLAHEAMSIMFQAESCAYTSLFFKHGSQQALHRDTPHFSTFPENTFFGLWTALEDVSKNNGPLRYVAGSHRLVAPSAESYVNTAGKLLMSIYKRPIREALDRYNGDIIELAEKSGLGIREAVISRGDVILWHPGLIHGGAAILKPGATRYSLVTHCVPRGIYVSYSDAYFGVENKEALNKNYKSNYRYAYCGDIPYIQSPRIYTAFQYD